MTEEKKQSTYIRKRLPVHFTMEDFFYLWAELCEAADKIGVDPTMARQKLEEQIRCVRSLIDGDVLTEMSEEREKWRKK